MSRRSSITIFITQWKILRGDGNFISERMQPRPSRIYFKRACVFLAGAVQV